jgi:hypothetical protein
MAAVIMAQPMQKARQRQLHAGNRLARRRVGVAYDGGGLVPLPLGARDHCRRPVA